MIKTPKVAMIIAGVGLVVSLVLIASGVMNSFQGENDQARVNPVRRIKLEEKKPVVNQESTSTSEGSETNKAAETTEAAKTVE